LETQHPKKGYAKGGQKIKMVLQKLSRGQKERGWNYEVKRRNKGKGEKKKIKKIKKKKDERTTLK